MSNVIDLNKVGNELNEEISNYLAKKLDSDDSSISETVIKPVLVSPEKQEWDVLSDVNGWNKRNDKSEMFGTFTVNPDTVTIHWEKLDPKRIIIKSLPEEFKGSGGTELNPNLAKDTVTIADVAKFITEEYGEDYYIPGIEYLKYLQDTKENWLKDKISKILTRMQKGEAGAVTSGFESFYFFGTVIYGKSKRGIYTQDVPCWTALNKMGTLGSLPWMKEHDRFVLIKKENTRVAATKNDDESVNLFQKFISGNYSLLKTFWLLNIFPLYLLVFLSDFTNGLSEIALIFYLPFSGISLWKSASKYSGLKLWKVLAKVVSVLFILQLPLFIFNFLI